MLFHIACTGSIDLFDRMVEQFGLSPNAWDKVSYYSEWPVTLHFSMPMSCRP